MDPRAVEVQEDPSKGCHGRVPMGTMGGGVGSGDIIESVAMKKSMLVLMI